MQFIQQWTLFGAYNYHIGNEYLFITCERFDSIDGNVSEHTLLFFSPYSSCTLNLWLHFLFFSTPCSRYFMHPQKNSCSQSSPSCLSLSFLHFLRVFPRLAAFFLFALAFLIFFWFLFSSLSLVGLLSYPASCTAYCSQSCDIHLV